MTYAAEMQLDGPYTVQHSDWGDDPYGWQVWVGGRVLDTYAHIAFANTYADFMNRHPALQMLDQKPDDNGEAT